MLLTFNVTCLFAFNNNEDFVEFTDEVRMSFNSKRSFQWLFCRALLKI